MNFRHFAGARYAAVTSLAAAFSVFAAIPAFAQTATRWSFTVQGAPQLPQDVWVSGLGNNTTGWNSGGSICLGVLAQGFSLGQHATILTDVLEAGVLGEDGQPVQATDASGNPIVYFAPGIDIPGRNFTLQNGHSFYVIMDGTIVNSNRDDFPVGGHFPLMFTFDFIEGRAVQEMVTWTKDPNGNWFPLLNEGLQSTNVRRVN